LPLKKRYLSLFSNLNFLSFRKFSQDFFYNNRFSFDHFFKTGVFRNLNLSKSFFFFCRNFKMQRSIFPIYKLVGFNLLSKRFFFSNRTRFSFVYKKEFSDKFIFPGNFISFMKNRFVYNKTFFFFKKSNKFYYKGFFTRYDF
jgi:hypothetical protein